MPDDALWTPALGRAEFHASHWETRHAHWRAADRVGASHADQLGLSVTQMLEFVDSMDRVSKGLKPGGKGTIETHIRLASADSAKCGPRAGHCKFKCSSGTGCARRKWSDGWSVVVSSAHMLLEPLRDLVHAFWQRLGMHTNANLYLSPTGSGAFDYHADETDVFVLQLDGEKQWELCGRRLPDVNAPTVQWDQVDTSAAWYLALVANCTLVELKRGDALYLPIGTIHRARGVGVDSLHCTIGVDRTFDLQGKPYRGLDWAGVLGAVAGSQGRDADGAAEASAQAFLRWLNQVATKEGAEVLRRLPRAWSSDVLPPPRSAAGLGWTANALLHSVDADRDLPCPSGSEPHAMGLCPALGDSLWQEYGEHVEPLLLEHAADAAADVPAHLVRLKQLFDGGGLGSAMRGHRLHMQESIPPLQLAPGYAPASGRRHKELLAAARDAAFLVDPGTLVRRAPELRAFVEHTYGELRANVPAVRWPQRIHARWKDAVTWALSAYGGAAGRPFSARALHRALQTCAWGLACAIRESETALQVVRWLVGLRVLEVVPGTTDEMSSRARLDT